MKQSLKPIKENHVLREIREVYRRTDASMAGVKSVCKKGCSFCCLQSVSIQWGEELPINRFVETKLDRTTEQKIGQNIRSWLAYFDRTTRPLTSPQDALTNDDILHFERQAAIDRFPCPFLIDNSCSIYPVRPLACRTFIVDDDPAICEANPRRDGHPRGYEVRDFQFQNLVKAQGRSYWFRLLAYAMKDKFGLTQPAKPIKSDVVGTVGAQN